MRSIYFCKSRLFSGRRLSFYSARSYSFAEYWKHFMTRLNGIHTFDYNSAGSEPIGLNLGQSEYIVCRWPCQILGAIRAEARARERADFLFFLSCEQRAISPTFRRPNFTKIAHKMWIRVAMTPFGTEFWKSSRKGSFSKKAHFRQRLAISGPYNSLTI